MELSWQEEASDYYKDDYQTPGRATTAGQESSDDCQRETLNDTK